MLGEPPPSAAREDRCSDPGCSCLALTLVAISAAIFFLAVTGAIALAALLPITWSLP